MRSQKSIDIFTKETVEKSDIALDIILVLFS